MANQENQDDSVQFSGSQSGDARDFQSLRDLIPGSLNNIEETQLDREYNEEVAVHRDIVTEGLERGDDPIRAAELDESARRLSEARARLREVQQERNP